MGMLFICKLQIDRRRTRAVQKHGASLDSEGSRAHLQTALIYQLHVVNSTATVSFSMREKPHFFIGDACC